MRAALLLIPLAGITGCLDSLVPEKDYDCCYDEPQTPPTDTPVTRADGPFVISTQLVIPPEQLVPAGERMMQTLRDFSAAPGNTLLSLAGSASDPALESLLDTELETAKVDGVSVPNFAAHIVAITESALTHLEVESTLRLSNGGSHQLDKLSIKFENQRVPLSVELSTDNLSVSMQGSTMLLGDHAFAISEGSYAWPALEAEMVRIHGASVEELVDRAVDCSAIAGRVCANSRCVATELASACEVGLDEVIERAKLQVDAVGLDELHFRTGTAKMIDVRYDGIADQLQSGVWTAEIDQGQGARPITGTFTAFALGGSF